MYSPSRRSVHKGFYIVRVAVRKVIQQPFQIAGYQNIHGRTHGFMEFAAGIVMPGVYKIRQDIVAIGGADEFVNGQPHTPCIVACKNIAEVSGGNNKIDLVAGNDCIAFAKIGICGEVIDNLRHQTAPVNGVCAAEAHSAARKKLVEGGIGKIRFTPVCASSKLPFTAPTVTLLPR